MHLYNRVNGEELKAKLLQSNEPRATLSFYRYVSIEDPRQFRDDLFATWAQMGVLGRIYVAHEGINAQMSMPEAQKEAFISWIQAHPLLTGVRLNWAVEDDGKSFYKLVIKVRHKIVADGLDDASFDPGNTGKYLSARDFNELTDQPGTIVVDMRNHYESEIGHFEGAICPDVDTFRDSLPIVRDMLKPFQDQPIVMYCTGGIRCEKASAWLKHEGFGQVYHLEGGIIKYARDAKEQGIKNKFRGKNF
ncbi:MAG: rhodanese-related sulfurtransferase [Bacteroidetes bacterium]|nr:MAG: rhodanese-related sulfurtransferase [Bacteroidota bacterium]